MAVRGGVQLGAASGSSMSLFSSHMAQKSISAQVSRLTINNLQSTINNLHTKEPGHLEKMFRMRKKGLRMRKKYLLREIAFVKKVAACVNFSTLFHDMF